MLTIVGTFEPFECDVRVRGEWVVVLTLDIVNSTLVAVRLNVSKESDLYLVLRRWFTWWVDLRHWSTRGRSWSTEVETLLVIRNLMKWTIAKLLTSLRTIQLSHGRWHGRWVVYTL